MNTPPRVTVLIAAFNEAKHLPKCLSSLRDQSYPQIEIIVIDDGSTDGTARVAAAFDGVRVIGLPHAGKAIAVNRGAREATGDILFFLDGDMIFDREYVERMVRPIIAGEALGTCHEDELVANPDNPWAACWQRSAGLPPDRRVVVSDAQRRAGSGIFRAVPRDRFLAVGGFDDTGFHDDQTLAPKLNARATFVAGAMCYHHNPETLREVFRTGTWGGKSIALQGGWKALVQYAPPVVMLRALRGLVTVRPLASVLYHAVNELGLFAGVAARKLRLQHHHGK